MKRHVEIEARPKGLASEIFFFIGILDGLGQTPVRKRVFAAQINVDLVRADRIIYLLDLIRVEGSALVVSPLRDAFLYLFEYRPEITANSKRNQARFDWLHRSWIATSVINAANDVTANLNSHQNSPQNPLRKPPKL